MGVMKMGSIVPRAGFKPTSLAFRASVLPLHHVDFSDVTIIPVPICLCSSLPQRSVQTITVVCVVYFSLFLYFLLVIYYIIMFL